MEYNTFFIDHVVKREEIEEEIAFLVSRNAIIYNASIANMYMYYPLRDKDRNMSDCFVNALFMAASSVLIRLYDRLPFLILHTCIRAYTLALDRSSKK